MKFIINFFKFLFPTIVELRSLSKSSQETDGSEAFLVNADGSAVLNYQNEQLQKSFSGSVRKLSQVQLSESN